MTSACCEPQSLQLEQQLIGLEGAHNARQLGGYKIGKQRIKPNLLLRSASLAKLSEQDSLLLCEHFHLQKIYDFRGELETKYSPDVIPGDAAYLPLSVNLLDQNNAQDKNEIKLDSQEAVVTFLLQHAENPQIQAFCQYLYDIILFDEASQDVYRRFFADLVQLDPADGAVIWHCSQGKDRAGCASALILAALGADRELIMQDFMLSKAYYDVQIAQIPVQTEAQKHVIETLLSANPEIFAASLDKVEAQYGSLQAYLTECIGLTQEMMATLREKYLE